MALMCCFVGLYFSILATQNSSFNNLYVQNKIFKLKFTHFRPVTGFIGDLLAGEMAEKFCPYAIYVGSANVFIYVLVWVVVRFRSASLFFFNF